MSVASEIKWPEELDRLAREAEPAALAKAEEIFAEAVAEHERQTAGYRFECRRWGDFLTVFIERNANEKDWYGSEPIRKVSTSLNIGETREIRLDQGHCFDRRGKVTYRAWVKRDGGEGGGSWGSGHGFSAPPKGYHYDVEPNLPYVPKARKLVEVAKDKDKGRGFHGWEHDAAHPSHVTPDYPRPAKDDVIRFVGIDAAVYAPAGKGQTVYDAIMAEIARGYEPPKQGQVPPHSDNKERENG